MDPTTWAARTPDAPAVTMDGETVTYAELADRAARIAHLLRVQARLEPGDHIAVCAHNSPDHMAITWAAQLSRLYWTTIGPRLTADEATFILADCGARVLFASRDAVNPPAWAGQLRRRLSIGGDVPGHEPLERALAGLPPLAFDGREGARMSYTAGSTGRPKGIERPLDPTPVDPATAGGRFRDVLNHIGVGPGSVFLVPAPLHHTAPIMFGMTAQRLGAHVILTERFNAEEVLDLIEEHQVTHVYLVPQPMMTRLLVLPAQLRGRIPRMPHVLHTAAPCPPEVKDRMLDWCERKVTEYFATSEGIGYSFLSGSEWAAHRGSVGRVRGGEVHVLDEAGTELAPGETGTLWFSAPGGGALPSRIRYRNRSTDIYDRRGWASVGDRGWLDADGYLYIAGRAGDMVISGGVNIYPREVEEALLGHPKVLDVAVRGVADPEWGQRVEAVVQVEKIPIDDLEAELIAFAAERIAREKRPRRVHFVLAPLHDERGKLVRNLIDQIAAPGPE